MGRSRMQTLRSTPATAIRQPDRTALDSPVPSSVDASVRKQMPISAWRRATSQNRVKANPSKKSSSRPASGWPGNEVLSFPAREAMVPFAQAVSCRPLMSGASLPCVVGLATSSVRLPFLDSTTRSRSNPQSLDVIRSCAHHHVVSSRTVMICFGPKVRSIPLSTTSSDSLVLPSRSAMAAPANRPCHVTFAA